MKSPWIRGTALAVFLAASSASARTWNSSDGSRQLDAELVAVAGDQVTLRLSNGQQGNYPLNLFSEADQTFTAEWLAKKDEEASVAAREPGALNKELDGKLVTWSGKRFSTYKPEGPPPEFYMLYFGASWCGPCREALPDLVKSYKSELEGKGKVELVHISRDSGEAGMEEFFEIADPTFPAVKFSRIDSLKIAMKHLGNFIPCYVLVDANGDLIAEGKEASLRKAAELLKQ